MDDHLTASLSRLKLTALVGLDLPLPAHPARSLLHRGKRMRALVCVCTDHDHMHRPFVWMTTDEADLRWTAVTRGECHAPIRSRRRSSGGDGRHKLCQSDQADDSALEGQPVASPRTNRTSRTSPPRHRMTLTVTALSTVAARALGSSSLDPSLPSGFLRVASLFG